MATRIKLSDIRPETISLNTSLRSSRNMLPGAIPGAAVYNHTVPAGETVDFQGTEKYISIFFLCSGSAVFSSVGKSFSYSEKAVFVTKPEDDVHISAASDISFVQICWDMNDFDLADLKESRDFPFSQAYADANQYRDFFKSEQTISRAIIPQKMIPRFAMGSVETKADDLIGQHAHPLLDQFFFSFPENNCNILIDSCIFPLKGNTMLHIPLGSNHGVIALGEQYVHYLWLDFTPQELKQQAVDYLDAVHTPTGKKESV